MDDSLRQYDRAEAILQQALKRPNLKDRIDLWDRLADLYDEWGKPEKSKALRLEQKKAGQAVSQPQAVLIEQKAKKRTKRGRRKWK
jgi:predicted Zn-dependent protease